MTKSIIDYFLGCCKLSNTHEADNSLGTARSDQDIIIAEESETVNSNTPSGVPKLEKVSSLSDSDNSIPKNYHQF